MEEKVLIVDRIEGDLLIVEFGDSYIKIPKSACNMTVCEGDVLVIGVDKEATEKRKKNVASRFSKLLQK